MLAGIPQSWMYQQDIAAERHKNVAHGQDIAAERHKNVAHGVSRG
jgi:hypothetical protein